MNDIKPVIFLFPVIALVLVASLYIFLLKKAIDKVAFKKMILVILILGFIVNLVWELVQMPLYKDADYTISHMAFCALASVADALMVLLIYLVLALIFKKSFWVQNARWQSFIIVIIVGAIGAILSEMRHLSLGNWAYSDAMPIIPIVNVGLIPVLQFMVLPSVVYITTNYILITRHNQSFNNNIK